jgi:hypothetical protein
MPPIVKTLEEDHDGRTRDLRLKMPARLPVSVSELFS